MQAEFKHYNARQNIIQTCWFKVYLFYATLIITLAPKWPLKKIILHFQYLTLNITTHTSISQRYILVKLASDHFNESPTYLHSPKNAYYGKNNSVNIEAIIIT